MTDKYSQADKMMSILFSDQNDWEKLFTNSIAKISKDALNHLDKWLQKHHVADPNNKFGRNDKGIDMISKERSRRLIDNNYNIERKLSPADWHKIFDYKCSTCTSDNMERFYDVDEFVGSIIRCRDCGNEDSISD